MADASPSNNALVSALNFIGSGNSSSELSPTENGRMEVKCAPLESFSMLVMTGEPILELAREGCRACGCRSAVR